MLRCLVVGTTTVLDLLFSTGSVSKRSVWFLSPVLTWQSIFACRIRANCAGSRALHKLRRCSKNFAFSKHWRRPAAREPRNNSLKYFGLSKCVDNVWAAPLSRTVSANRAGRGPEGQSLTRNRPVFRIWLRSRRTSARGARPSIKIDLPSIVFEMSTRRWARVPPKLEPLPPDHQVLSLRDWSTHTLFLPTQKWDRKLLSR